MDHKNIYESAFFKCDKQQLSDENISSVQKTKAILKIKDKVDLTRDRIIKIIRDDICTSSKLNKFIAIEIVERDIAILRDVVICPVLFTYEQNQAWANVMIHLTQAIKKKLKTEVSYCHSLTTFVPKQEENQLDKHHQDEVNSNVLFPLKKLENGQRSKPNDVSFCIFKQFSDTGALVQYLSNNVKEFTSSIQIRNTTFLPNKTYFTLELLKADEKKRLTFALCKQKNITIYQKEEAERVEVLQKERLIRQIKSAKEVVSNHVSHHEKKIHRGEEQISSLKIDYNAGGNHEQITTENEISAIAMKTSELRCQKEIFEKRCQTLIEELSVSNSVEQNKQLFQSISIECNRISEALPMYGYRDDILNIVNTNQVSIIIGETGSGKSTQMAQYIYESGALKEGLIVCTQPRKIAARTLAERVASEMLTNRVGDLVGYQAGSFKKISSKTKIVYTTDHSLLNEFLKDPNLSEYSCIIVDEAHERSIYTDLLLGMIKTCLVNRPDMKVVITSATIDPDIFLNYFSATPGLLYVTGKTFPVKTIYESGDANYVFEKIEEKAVSKVVEIHNSGEDGDILIFLTSAVEIMRCCEETKKRLKKQTNYECLPLHGQLQCDEQQKVFKKLKPGIRKIVFATNCAETSVTIDGIKFVVDPGVSKERRFDSKKNISLLQTSIISQSSANQRKGRAGRTASGTCYRLYSRESFQNMPANSDPEILRVHLGQAVLKLAELGINWMSYDFVQSPDEGALKKATDTLIEIGAIENGIITEVGKWISILPFEPRKSFMVYLGYKYGILYESIIIAALLNNCSDIFYRGFDEEDQQNSAMNKSKFASTHGDAFTMLNVYHIWALLPKKQQLSWCLNHSVNFKLMNYTKLCIKEVIDALYKAHGIKVIEDFSEPEKTETLRKIIFKATISMLGYYLGHYKAGYFAPDIQRQVHLHPSSSIVCHNAYPTWIVYSDFIKTSRDFIKGITVIDESWVKEASLENQLTVPLHYITSKKVRQVHQEEVGRVTFRFLVGPCYRNLTVIENVLSEAGMKHVVVEANRDFGSLEIYSSSSPTISISNLMVDLKRESINALGKQEKEFALDSKDKNGCRIMFGQGGSIKDILMPGEITKVVIRKVPEMLTKDHVTAKMSVFGEIKECFSFKSAEPWGIVRYSTHSEAEGAVVGTKLDETICASMFKMDHNSKHNSGLFKARISWYRRLVKGTGTAFIKCPPTLRQSLIGHSINVEGNSSIIRMSNKGEDLVCFKTGKSTEDDIKTEILALLTQKLPHEEIENLENQIIVQILREKRDCLSLQEMNDVKTLIVNEFNVYLNPPNDVCSLEFKKTRNTDIKQVGFIYFNNPVSGYHACQYLKHVLIVEGQKVEISPQLKTTINIPYLIMEACRLRFEELIHGLRKHKATTVTITELERGDFRLDICSDNGKCIVEALEVFRSELDGDIIECGKSSVLGCLFTQKSLKHLKDIEKTHNIVIINNHRLKQLHLYGLEKDVNNAKVAINDYLSRLVDGKEEYVFLKGPKRPPGLMKALMLEHGHTLNGLVTKFAIADIKVDFKLQKLTLIGKTEQLKKCIDDIEELSTHLIETLCVPLNSDMPDCVVCMCPVEGHADLYRLEGCGHSYCKACIQMQARVSIHDKQFPITCAKENCEMQLVWRDFDFFLKNKWIEEDKLVSMSVNSHVEKNPGVFKFCPTANCPIIYKVTSGPNGSVFSCPSCFCSFCSSCNNAPHPGLTCEMSTSVSNAEKELERWTKEKPGSRKICPGCTSPIEKIEGCNKMTCTSCKTVFCWLCCKICENENECYKHLQSEHGGIM